MRTFLPLSLLFVLSLSTACSGPACHSGADSYVGSLVRVPLGQPVDRDLREGSPSDGAVTLEATTALPAGLSITGTHLVGTPTEAGSFTIELEAVPADTSICTSEHTFPLEVGAIECATTLDCVTRDSGMLYGNMACSASADCGPGARCAPLLAGGVCLRTNEGCSGEIAERTFTDVEGASFQSCATTSVLTCTAPGFCD